MLLLVKSVIKTRLHRILTIVYAHNADFDDLAIEMIFYGY